MTVVLISSPSLPYLIAPRGGQLPNVTPPVPVQVMGLPILEFLSLRNILEQDIYTNRVMSTELFILWGR